MNIAKSNATAGDIQTLVPICAADSLAPGQMRACDVANLPPLAIYNLDGEYLATSNICTHEVALLTDGYFEGELVECAMHGGSFNVRTGEAKSLPCKERLQVFSVVVKDGQVFVKI